MEFVQENAGLALELMVFDEFKAHAVEQTGQNGFGDLVSFSALDQGKHIGVVMVRGYWGAIHVKSVWVRKDNRGKGLGKMLLRRALAYGKEKNYSFAFVETMSFQALEFYQKMGFVLEYTRSGYVGGVSFHYLRKDFT